jgi:hypothetical protein
MITGKSCGNCSDGDVDIGDGYILKGIERQGEVGMLTLFEHYGHYEIGKLLKNP